MYVVMQDISFLIIIANLHLYKTATVSHLTTCRYFVQLYGHTVHYEIHRHIYMLLLNELHGNREYWHYNRYHHCCYYTVWWCYTHAGIHDAGCMIA